MVEAAVRSVRGAGSELHPRERRGAVDEHRLPRGRGAEGNLRHEAIEWAGSGDRSRDVRRWCAAAAAEEEARGELLLPLHRCRKVA